MAASVLTPGLVTGVGSLPHHDPVAAARFSVAHAPGLPFLPELPAAGRDGSLVGAAAASIPGVRMDADGELFVDEAALTAPPAGLDPGSSTGRCVAALAAALADDADRAGGDGRWRHVEADGVDVDAQPVKWQVCGPITLALALVEGGLGADRALRVAVAAVRARTAAVHSAIAAALPHAPQVVVLDEPGLVALDHPSFPWAPDEAIDALAGSLAVAERANVVTGVHCCGPTDWSYVTDAGATVLSMPVDQGLALTPPGTLARHLDRGGWIAWGVVPTDRPIGTSAERWWHGLAEAWTHLARAGVDPALLGTQALLTPACGFAHHGVSQAALVLELCAQLTERVRSQAVATRISLQG